MASYRLRYSEETRQALRNLPGFYRQRAKRLIEDLADNPYPAKSKLLRGATNIYRLWLDSWRVIYEVDEEIKVVYIVAIREKTGPETYEGLP